MTGPSGFGSVTERPGDPATAQQSLRLEHRYGLVASLIDGGQVLEVSSGTGIGLGNLQLAAKLAVGLDLDRDLLSTSRAHYGERVPLVQGTAVRLPFRGDSFDVVACLEAIYYYPSPKSFVEEAARTLKPGGRLIISTVNPAWTGFTPSKLSNEYPSAEDLRGLMQAAGLSEIEILGAFPSAGGGMSASMVGLIRRTAAVLHLIPDTLGSRARLKRIFYGKMEPLPAELARSPKPHDLVPIVDDGSSAAFTIVYALGRKLT